MLKVPTSPHSQVSLSYEVRN